MSPQWIAANKAWAMRHREVYQHDCDTPGFKMQYPSFVFTRTYLPDKAPEDFTDKELKTWMAAFYDTGMWGPDSRWSPYHRSIANTTPREYALYAEYEKRFCTMTWGEWLVIKLVFFVLGALGFLSW